MPIAVSLIWGLLVVSMSALSRSNQAVQFWSPWGLTESRSASVWR